MTEDEPTKKEWREANPVSTGKTISERGDLQSGE